MAYATPGAATQTSAIKRLLPWAVALRELSIFGLVEVFIFIAILLVGYIWVWKKGAFEWE